MISVNVRLTCHHITKPVASIAATSRQIPIRGRHPPGIDVLLAASVVRGSEIHQYYVDCGSRRRGIHHELGTVGFDEYPMFWNTANRRFRHTIALTDTRWLAGRIRKLSLRSGAGSSAPPAMCGSASCRLVTGCRRRCAGCRSEASWTGRAKSMIRGFATKRTAGLARLLIKFLQSAACGAARPST